MGGGDRLGGDGGGEGRFVSRGLSSLSDSSRARFNGSGACFDSSFSVGP